MPKLYAVTSGEYSDYGIEALFSSREKAVEYYLRRKAEDAKRYGYADPLYLEEHEDGEAYERADLEMFNVVFDAYGNVEKVTNDVPRTEDLFVFNDGRSSVYVFAEDTEKAVKIAAERRAVALSLREGI